jgi:hypothetical protein
MIAGAKKALLSSIPYRKCKIADQVIDAILSPHLIRAEDELNISDLLQIMLDIRFQALNEIVPAVNPRVCDDPDLSIEAAWLVLARRFISRTQ